MFVLLVDAIDAKKSYSYTGRPLSFNEPVVCALCVAPTGPG